MEEGRKEKSGRGAKCMKGVMGGERGRKRGKRMKRGRERDLSQENRQGDGRR